MRVKPSPLRVPARLGMNSNLVFKWLSTFLVLALHLASVPGSTAAQTTPPQQGSSYRNLSEARIGADTGQLAAQLDLAFRYLQGREVPRDRTLALVWFNIAAAKGDRRAQDERDKLEKALTPAQIAEAESIARDWKPKQFLETSELRQSFKQQLDRLSFDASDNFAPIVLQKEKSKMPPLPSLPSEESWSWTTNFSFQGASSSPCALLISDGKHTGVLDCQVFISADPGQARSFFSDTCQRLLTLLPASWLFKGSHPNVMGKTCGFVETLPFRKPGIVLSLDLSEGSNANFVTIAIFGADDCEKHSFECEGTPIREVLEKGSQSALATPPAPSGPAMEGIKAQIDDVVRSGRFTTLPPVQPIAGSFAHTRLTITNQTAYSLTVMMDGPAERSVTVSPGDTETLVLAPGSYRVLGRVAAPNVLPFFGTQNYAVGTSYQESFHVDAR